MWTGPPSYAGGFGGGLNCCADKDNPAANIRIGYDTLSMNCGDIQGFTIEGLNSLCDASNYGWTLSEGGGTLDDSNPLAPVYHAPAGGPDSESPVVINLFCGGELRSSIIINLTPDKGDSLLEYTSNQMLIDEDQTFRLKPGSIGCGSPGCVIETFVGGVLVDSHQGDSIVYTSPHTNPSCANNPTIVLSCYGVEIGRVTVAINGYASAAIAYMKADPILKPCLYIGTPASCACRCTYIHFKCDNTFYTYASSTCASDWHTCTVEEMALPCPMPGSCVVIDERTTYLITHGCCPAGVL